MALLAPALPGHGDGGGRLPAHWLEQHMYGVRAARPSTRVICLPHVFCGVGSFSLCSEQLAQRGLVLETTAEGY